jgi:hypothetical protein
VIWLITTLDTSLLNVGNTIGCTEQNVKCHLSVTFPVVY